MLSALIIVFREGFEAFLSVAIILTFLRKTNRDWLRPTVYVAVVVSLLTSVALGWALMTVGLPSLWEGIIGLVAAVMVATFVIQVWRAAPHMKHDMETKLDKAVAPASRWAAIAGVFAFTAMMVLREGIETALMLVQVRDTRFILGSLLGLLAAAMLSWAWAHYGHRINVKRFFQVTGLFLLLFTVQILFYALHEFSEAGVIPNADAIHEATEPYSPVGIYGKWFSVLMVGACALWLIGGTIVDKLRAQQRVTAS